MCGGLFLCRVARWLLLGFVRRRLLSKTVARLADHMRMWSDRSLTGGRWWIEPIEAAVASAVLDTLPT